MVCPRYMIMKERLRSLTLREVGLVADNIDRVCPYYFYIVNPLKGVKGSFYTTNRRQDLLDLCKEVIREKWEEVNSL